MKDPWKTEQSFNNLFYNRWLVKGTNEYIILSNMMFILGLIIMIKCTTLHINRCQEKIIWSLLEDKICSFQLSKGIHLQNFKTETMYQLLLQITVELHEFYENAVDPMSHYE